MDKFRWAFIGSGAIAKKVAHEIVASGRHEIVSVYSRTYDRAKQFADKYGARVYESMQEAISDERVDAVYLATPHSCHYQEMQCCIANGVPVLSEKAFTINARQVECIIDNANNSYVSEAMWTRYNPITIKVREIVRSGQIGDIESIKGSFCYPRALSTFSDRLIKREYGGGALLDIGVYLVSYVAMLLGEPDEIETKCKFNKYSTDDFDDIVMKYNGGATAHIKCGIDRLSTYMMTIKGSKGKITIPLFYRPIIAFVNANGKRYRLTSKAGYIHQFDKVAQDIRCGKRQSEEISLSDSLEVMRILDRIRIKSSISYDESIESIDIVK